MPEFEILWAPLSRKWQVWQQQSDDAGCTIETLIGEYSSEGRANHEAAVLRGDLPAGAAYQAPRRRHWFSPLRLISGSPRSDAVTPVSNDATTPGDISETSSPVDSSDGPRESEGTTGTPISDGGNASEWRQGLIARLELVRRHAEQDEVESVRRYLREALHVIPGAHESDEAA